MLRLAAFPLLFFLLFSQAAVPASGAATLKDKTNYVHPDSKLPTTSTRADSIAGAEAKALSGFAGSVGLSLTTDDSRKKRSSELNTSVEVKKGIFPNEIRFAAEMLGSLDGPEFEDRLSRFRLNFDRNLDMNAGPEAFVFAERFNSDALGITSRYEVGGGLKYDFLVNDLTQQGKNVLEALDSVSKGIDTVSIHEGLLEHKSRWRVGLSAALFDEMQKSSVTTSLYRDSTHTTVLSSEFEAEVSSRQVLRLSLRPSVTFMPDDEFMLRIQYFEKIALAGDTKRPRRDFRLNATYAFETKGDAKVDIGFEFTVTKDEGPPTLDHEAQRRYEKLGQFVALGGRAQGRQSVARLKIGFEFD